MQELMQHLTAELNELTAEFRDKRISLIIDDDLTIKLKLKLEQALGNLSEEIKWYRETIEGEVKK